MKEHLKYMFFVYDIDSYTELEGKVIFKSEQPVSFCLTIDFSDDDALAVCSLKVYAIADDSLLTTYVYSLSSHFDMDFIYEEKSKDIRKNGVDEEEEILRAYRHVRSNLFILLLIT
jgi:hypothetical protein